MPIEFVVDMVEQQENITYLVGSALQALNLEDVFTHLCVYQPAQKRNQSPKLQEITKLSLKLVSIVVQGEPQTQLPAESSAQIGVEGDISSLMSLLDAHKWHHKNGRYVLARNETRIISLQGD